MAGGQGEGEGQDGEGKAGSQAGKDHTWDEASGYDTTGKGHSDSYRESDRTSEWEEEFQDLYDPDRLRDAESLFTVAEGELDTEGHIDTLPVRLLPGDDEQVKLPGLDMPDEYREAAADALEDEAIPPGYRKQVKNYFDSVTGEGTPE